jgi:hypothetical protein
VADPIAIPWTDPVVEAYKRDVDRTLLRENLKLTPAERLLAVQRLVEFVGELRQAMKKAKSEHD